MVQRPSPLMMPRTRPVAEPPPLRWSLTAHARQRATELGYTEAEVLACAQEPDLTYETDPKKYGPGEWLCKRHDIAVVVKKDTLTVVTVLLPKTEQWTHGQDRR